MKKIFLFLLLFFLAGNVTSFAQQEITFRDSPAEAKDVIYKFAQKEGLPDDMRNGMIKFSLSMIDSTRAVSRRIAAASPKVVVKGDTVPMVNHRVYVSEKNRVMDGYESSMTGVMGKKLFNRFYEYYIDYEQGIRDNIVRNAKEIVAKRKTVEAAKKARNR